MLLTEHQEDALKEIISMAFARAAASLSDLINRQIILFIPEISIHSISRLSIELSTFIPKEIVTINQTFKGEIAGNALLVMNYDSAVDIANMLTDNQASPECDFNMSAYEILLEVGNILLNSCLGVFSNLLQIPLHFTAPTLRLEKVNEMINSLVCEQTELSYALVLKTSLQVIDSEVNCYFVLVSGVTSLHSLILAIENWADLSLVH